MLEFRLLGPVEGRWQGARIHVGPRKSRFVLAVLALEVNRSVAVDRLVELTWPESPPRTAGHAIQVFVSHVRAALAAVPQTDVRIERHGSGYLLRCDPERVDAHRFRSLAGQARQQADDHRVVALLDGALDLWYGDALDGCAPPEVREPLCRGLEEARLTAFEDRLDARLRLGAHRAVLDELTDLVARHPLRERLVGQLMLALYRDDRAGEALSAYRGLRDRLAEHLGLDPGAQLKRLEMAILRADPAIRAPLADPPAQERPTPEPPTPEPPTPQPPIPDQLTPDQPNRVRVVLVDDHPMFRAGLRVALESDPGIAVVAEAGDVAEAIRVTARVAADVVVMDLHLPDRSGFEATRALRAAHPTLSILVMTMSGADEHIVDALRAGARGYVLKSAGRDEILGAIRGVAQGSTVFSADVAARLAVLAGARSHPV